MVVLAERAQHDDRTASDKRFGVDIYEQVILFEATLYYKPISSKDEAKLHPCCNKMLPNMCIGYVLRAGRGGDLVFAGIAKTSRTCQLPILTSKVSNTIGKAHKM